MLGTQAQPGPPGRVLESGNEREEERTPTENFLGISCFVSVTSCNDNLSVAVSKIAALLVDNFVVKSIVASVYRLDPRPALRYARIVA